MKPRLSVVAYPAPPFSRRRGLLSSLSLAAGVLSCLSLTMISSAEAAGPAAPPSGGPAPAVTLAAEVMVLHATNAGGGIDNRIGSLAQLKKPPFSAYDTYKLLTQARTPLTQGVESPSALPDGGKVRMTLKQAVSPGRRKMAVTIQKSDGSVFLPLVEVTTGADEPFFVAGYRHKNGILVIGIKLVG